MPHKGPHISIESESLVQRVLHINADDFEDWPESVRRLAMEIAEELFLVRYNPFINPETVKNSVAESFDHFKRGLALHYANTISEGITMFWSAHESDMAFRKEIIARLEEILPKKNIDLRPASRVENATDATDLRHELPLLVVTPSTAEEVSAIVKLANEMQFALIPRGGGSGLTGGAIPLRKRTVMLSLTKFTRIKEVDAENLTLTAEAGVTTIDAMNAASAKGLLFSVDPASKTASSIGGNVAENSGGPLAVEYGTAIDNLLSYRMVLPTGEIIEIFRRNHPRHKIEDDDEAIFEVRDPSGGLRNLVTIKGSELRKTGLGKDVTNKTLNGLPGVQKEGIDGIILEASFVLYPRLKYNRVIVLEFFGRSMHNATLAINDLMRMREHLRDEGGQVKLSMLEEFNSKYVQAIEYQKKSSTYEGHPISVLIIQLDSNDEQELEKAVERVAELCKPYDGVDAFIAKDDKEAELFWEDRHKLSAIAKRTSGFKVNEDVVIPLASVPEFALFLEQLNVECMAGAFRRALQEVGRLKGMAEDDKDFNREFTYASRLMKGEIPHGKEGEEPLADSELKLHAVLYLAELREKYPHLAAKISKIEARMLASRVEVASHMHAGDGNCHVNIPVNSGDVDMMAEAEHVAERVMLKAQEIGGVITGEHGIGITKIAFQEDEKIKSIREFKNLVDPKNIINPAKLTQRELPQSSFTFSFNRLIGDLKQSGLPDKERLIELLLTVQNCTRCGKCKEVCPMHYPERDYLYYPRNRNIALGALIEALYYSQVNDGEPDPALLREVRQMMEHCTACGKCKAVCPVKIDSADVSLRLRSIMDEAGKGGHPIKSRILNYLAVDPAKRIPKTAKLASLGQRMQNKFLPLVPSALRSRFYNPAFSSPGPEMGYKNLSEALKLERGSIFVPKLAEGESPKGSVLYFPGCGGSIFYRSIGQAAVMLALKAGWAIVLPDETLCCGYPLLASGMQESFAVNQDRNISKLREVTAKAAALGLPVSRVLTSCGSCRDGIERHFLPQVFEKTNQAAGQDAGEIIQFDVVQFLLQEMAPPENAREGNNRPRMLYHSPCHAEWTGVNKKKAGASYAKALGGFAGLNLTLSPGCCGESGMGAISSPLIYNTLRERKAGILTSQLEDFNGDTPVLVGCPSCKIGVKRTLMGMKDKRPVLHSQEYLAELYFGQDWKAKGRKLIVSARNNRDGSVLVDLAKLKGLTLAEADKESDE